MTTIKDVAERAGVSTATVSRALNRHPAVRPDVRGRVFAAVEALAYWPNAAARSLRLESAMTLGLVIGDILNPFFTELARAVEDEAYARGFSVLLGNGDEDPHRQDDYLGVLLQRRVDGLLLVPTGESSPLIRDVAARGAPIVLVDREIEGLDVPVVRADGRRAIADLVRHLAALGHERVAMISGPQSVSTGRERLAAFREATALAGFDPAGVSVEPGDFQLDRGVEAMGRLMAVSRPPTAVFTADNLMALGALQWARSHGARVPQDVGIASFDDPPWFEFAGPPITAIAQPTEDIGHAGVRALIDRIHGKPTASVTFESRLAVRRSCGEWDG
ncbi:MAG: LacI family DNA-binding transcriptional regulator [Carbonactinosporaceae bacterium]